MRNVFPAFFILLALSLPAAAQSWLEPNTTTPLFNKKGEAVGTATRYGNQMYLRDVNGVLLYTLEKSAAGLKMFDPNGKPVDFQVTDPGISRVLTPSDQRQKE
jgi:hypothetical protein